jgi:hypothetical protein
MEINKLNRNALNTYKTISNTKPSDKKDSGGKSGNVDKIEFDFERSIGAAKVNIAEKLDAGANLERIAKLQEKYSGDNCPVSPEAVAAAITGD